MSPSPARGNKEPPPLPKGSDASNLAYLPVEDMMMCEEYSINANEPDEGTKALFNMIKNINNRLDTIEKNNTKKPATNNIISPPSQQDVINRLIAANEELMSEVQRLKKIIASHIPSAANPNPRPPTFAEKLTQSARTQPTPTRIPHPLPAPPNKVINMFKRGNILIRTKREGEKPFQKDNAEKIAGKVIKALKSLDVRVNGEEIEIKSVIRYESGDVRFYTKDRAQARWLLENRHQWTHLADPLFITSQALFPVLIHSVPTQFDITDESLVEDFCQENDIPMETIKKLKWVGDPCNEEKAHGSLIAYFSNKEIANDIIRGHLAYKRSHLQTANFQPGPIQCFNCLKVGHIAGNCKNRPMCIRCGHQHNIRECKEELEDRHCIRCMNYDMENDEPVDRMDEKYFHSVFSNNQCPPQRRIRIIGRFSETRVSLIPSASHNKISILQLNCHNRKDTILSLLNTEQEHVALLIQEPWVYFHNLQPPTHNAWRRITPTTLPQTRDERPRTCIYIRNYIPSKNITIGEGNNKYLTSVSIDLDGGRKLTMKSLYNPPTSFEGIDILRQNLNNTNCRTDPTIIAMDSNLHSKLWNPRGYNHIHPQAKDLISICTSKGFKLCSPKGTPTFTRSTNIATTIDLLWANLAAVQLLEKTDIEINNHSSDHQPIKTILNLKEKTLEVRNPYQTMKITELNEETFTQDIRRNFAKDLQSNTQRTKEKIDEDAEWISSTLRDAYLKQGKWVNTNTRKAKAWWDKGVLNPMVRERNRARRWLLLTRSAEADNCYKQWQQAFKAKVEELKRNHWRNFLATNGPNHAFDAFRFTKTMASGEVHPLKTPEGRLTNDKQEQADLFFKMFAKAGTPIEETEGSPPMMGWNQPLRFEKLTTDEVRTNIEKLPNKKSPGPDGIPNELIKIACNLIINKLTDLFNNCLTAGHFPTSWKKASTVIIQKANKSDYSDPSAYRPIALLNTLSKLFERILNNRIMYWAHKTGAIANGHFGGRRGRNIEEAMILLDSWIKEKWRNGKVVAGLFLDVKSAYPAVHKEKLLQVLTQKQAPDYILAIIRSFLTMRHTDLKLDDFKSQMKLLERGLPQGSPLSVTLYLLYNSELLNADADQTESNRLSIGYIDDITHLVAADTTTAATSEMENLGRRTIEWGRKMGSEFDKKKTKFMLFTDGEVEQGQLTFGEERLNPVNNTRWLGITLDPKLNYAGHIETIKSRSDTTLAQINRISNKYYGIGVGDTRTLIKAVLYTRLLFGSVLWLNTSTQNKIKPILEKTYNKAARMIMGSLKSTPLIFLRRDSELMPILATHIIRTHNMILRLATKEETHPVKARALRETHETQT
ncbi:hypothetical protein O181_054081 [Austropuccinia psidii MF-1]|uniref:Reverse transcriptase domain-containing protein n=1 Tax=Austropuccinia psidii MF-1 TaxID=1389203 RepID=A0A9Q3E1T4_9BASI|nr:hypothetical protein [Austropuccinia psidii MF-1]